MTSHNISPTLGWDDVFIMCTQDGSDTLYSHAYQTTYHSVFGAVGESRHVFLQHGLQSQQFREKISILEFGFGTGLNAFIAFLFSLKTNKPVQYTGIESHPIDPAIAYKLDYPAYLAFPEEKEVFLRLHTDPQFSYGSFDFSKISLLKDLPSDKQFDCIFFDAFAPVNQPEMWEQDIFDTLFKLTSSGGCLVTYCAQGEVRRRMAAAGFEMERLPGPPGKREMLRAVKKA
jgi:tRNA U34 5-methylaminomethyl-2-thiouridine-forming methyltransferase MnmC